MKTKTQTKNTKKKVRVMQRVDEGKIFFGVCTGMADYVEIDVTLIRLVFVVLFFAGGSGILVYLIMALIMPKKNEKNKDVEVKVRELAFEAKGLAKDFVKDVRVKKGKDKNNGRVFVGLIVVMIGLMILLRQFIPGWWNELFWPLVLIVVGGYLVLKK